MVGFIYLSSGYSPHISHTYRHIPNNRINQRTHTDRHEHRRHTSNRRPYHMKIAGALKPPQIADAMVQRCGSAVAQPPPPTPPRPPLSSTSSATSSSSSPTATRAAICPDGLRHHRRAGAIRCRFGGALLGVAFLCAVLLMRVDVVQAGDNGDSGGNGVTTADAGEAENTAATSTTTEFSKSLDSISVHSLVCVRVSQQFMHRRQAISMDKLLSGVMIVCKLKLGNMYWHLKHLSHYFELNCCRMCIPIRYRI